MWENQKTDSRTFWWRKGFWNDLGNTLFWISHNTNCCFGVVRETPDCWSGKANGRSSGDAKGYILARIEWFFSYVLILLKEKMSEEIHIDAQDHLITLTKRNILIIHVDGCLPALSGLLIFLASLWRKWNSIYPQIFSNIGPVLTDL